MLCAALIPATALATGPGEHRFDERGKQARAAGPYTWAKASLAFVKANKLLPEGTLKGGPAGKVSRNAYAFALVALDAWRTDRYGDDPEFSMEGRSVSLKDAPTGSLGARMVGLGWLLPVAGKFSGTAPVTADEASTGIVGAMGLRDQGLAFAKSLRSYGLSGSRRSYYAASQVMARELDMRYNHLQGTEKMEVGPSEPMTVAETAYMLYHAAQSDSWRVDNAGAFAEFSLPKRTVRQQKLVKVAMSFIGMPYIWAGETEGTQPEGHPGFDCSGFVWRVVNGGMKATDHFPLKTRTSETMSADMPKAKRIKNPAKLRTGDILFWGYHGHRSAPKENYHTGLYLGNGWFIHSSGSNDGVSIDKLDGYWLDQWSWARRIVRS
jgi:cell wall-associated NlpC family hydrolase